MSYDYVMKNKLRSISRFEVPFQSAIFSKTFEVVAVSKGAAIRSAMYKEEFAPRRCFGTPKRIKVIQISGLHPFKGKTI